MTTTQNESKVGGSIKKRLVLSKILAALGFLFLIMSFTLGDLFTDIKAEEEMENLSFQPFSFFIPEGTDSYPPEHEYLIPLMGEKIYEYKPSGIYAYLIGGKTMPIWRVTLKSPQYPKSAYPRGVFVSFRLTDMTGMVEEMTALNHYIGMDPVEAGAVLIRQLITPGYYLFAVMLIVSFFYNGPFWWLLRLIPSFVPVYFLFFYTKWLYWYGHNLRDFGAFKVDPFMPTVLGTGKVENFDTYAYPAIGFYFLMIVLFSLVMSVLIKRRALVDQRGIIEMQDHYLQGLKTSEIETIPITNELATAGVTKRQRVDMGPGLRTESIPKPGYPGNKNRVRNIRWIVLISINFFFFASYYFDLHLLEGSLSSSRLFGFRLSDPFAALQAMLASGKTPTGLLVGLFTIVFIYFIAGGRTFCSWICPYHLLAEWTEKIHLYLENKRIMGAVKTNNSILRRVEDNTKPGQKRSWNHTFDYTIKYYIFVLFLIVSFVYEVAVFQLINPVGILSRAIVYGPGIALIIVGALLSFEIFYSRLAWCRYFCPVGVAFNIIGKFSLFKVKWDQNKCVNCKKCQRACMVPFVMTDTVSIGVDKYVTSGECTNCGKCIDACQDGALKYTPRYLDKII